MASPKTLSFQRVRVMVDSEAGLCRPRGQPRNLPVPRPAVELSWRQAARQSSASPTAPGRAPEEEKHPGLPGPGPSVDEVTGPTAPRSSVWTSLTDGRPEPIDHTHTGGTTVPGDTNAAASDALPPRSSRTAASDRPGRVEPMAVPVAAIARAVEDATTLRALVDLVAETCSGEGKRETGPWEFTLPLRAHGLRETRLCLRLSQAQLSLRFLCDGASARDLLSRQSTTLREQLSVRMNPPLEVEITLDDV